MKIDELWKLGRECFRMDWLIGLNTIEKLDRKGWNNEY